MDVLNFAQEQSMALANEVSISGEAGLRVCDGGSGRGQRVTLAVGLLPVLPHLMNACMHVQFCSSFEKAAKSGAQDYQLGRAPLRVLLADEAEMEGRGLYFVCSLHRI